MTSKVIFITFTVVLVLSLLITVKVILGRRKSMRILAEDRIREETLDRMILNESNNTGEKQIYAATPVEVSYDQRKIKEGKKNAKVMLQIDESSELSSRKYVLDPAPKIHFGAKQGANQIIVSGDSISDRQCEILEAAGRIYVHNIGNSGCVILKRGRQSAYVEQQYVELKTADELLIGRCSYQIHIIRTEGK